MQHAGKWGKKVDTLYLGQMATMSLCGENLKKSLLQNHWPSCLETWYVATGYLLLQNDLGLTLKYFMTRSDLVLGLSYGKNEKKILLMLCPLILKCIHIQPLWNSRGQGHWVTFAKGHLSFISQYFQRTSSLKLLDQFQLNFICSLQAKGERIYIMVQSQN